MGAARELTASMPLAPTPLCLPPGLLGMASPVKVRSGRGMGGLEGSRKDGQGGWDSTVPTTHTDPLTALWMPERMYLQRFGARGQP